MTTTELFDQAMRHELDRPRPTCVILSDTNCEVAYDLGVKIGDRQGYLRGKAESDQSVHEEAVRVGLIVGFFAGMFITLFIQWWRNGC